MINIHNYINSTEPGIYHISTIAQDMDLLGFLRFHSDIRAGLRKM